MGSAAASPEQRGRRAAQDARTVTVDASSSPTRDTGLWGASGLFFRAPQFPIPGEQRLGRRAMSVGAHSRPPGNRAPPFARLCCVLAALGMLWSPASLAFNLDVDKLTVYTGPEGSYFGYSLDFYIPDART